MRSAFRLFVTCLVFASTLSVAWAAAPARPGVVRSKKVSNTQVLITWKDRGQGETLYIVQRKRADRNRFLTRVVLPRNTTEFVDTVDPKRVYVYRVLARNDAGESRRSADCFVNRTPPPKPTSIAVRIIALRTAKISWDDRSQTETGFRIERRTEGSPTFKTVGEVDPGEEKFIDRTLQAATSYTYRVRSLGDPRHCIKHARPSREVLESTKGAIRVVNVSVVGSGSGYVVSVPEGINCGPQRRHCSAEFRLGQDIRLIPTANGTSRFRRWDGDRLCRGKTGRCNLRMGENRTVAARFHK
ncbi:MAG: hypothetical protein ACI8TX_002481 [Hyphomicrobiaceae bacterium]|jgi:hypothetical protein